MILVLLAQLALSVADPTTGSWFASLMQPDNPSISCCGPADAYFAETFQRKGKTIARVLRPARAGNPVAPGYEVEIPAHKMNRDPNRYADSVVFLSPDGHVYCFISGAGV